MNARETYINQIMSSLNASKEFNGTFETNFDKDQMEIKLLLSGPKNRSETINLEPFYENNEPIDSVVNILVSHYKLMRLTMEDKPFDEVNDRIIYELINKQSVIDYLPKIPYIELSKDMILIFKLYLSESDSLDFVVCLLDNEQLDKWNKGRKDKINSKNLFEYASVNTPILQSLFLIPLQSDETHSFNSIVVTNKTEEFGAAAFLYPDVLKKISENIGDDLIIFPANIHSVYIIPYCEVSMWLPALKESLRNINKERGREMLSSFLYLYTKDKQVIETI